MRAGTDGPWLRLFRALRIPRPLAGWERCSTPVRQAARTVSHHGVAHRTRPATHRLDPRARGHSCDEPPRTGRRNSPGCAQCVGHSCTHVAPSAGPPVWYERYGTRIEDTRLPQGQAKRDAYAQMVGEDGFALLDALEAPETPKHLQELPMITTLRRTWQRHYDRSTGEGEPWIILRGPASASSRIVSYPQRRRASNRPMIRKRAIGRNATRNGPGTWCMSAKRVSPPHPTCSRRCTRPLLQSMRPSAPNPSTRLSARKTWRHWSISSMAPISARHCSPRAGTSTVSRGAAHAAGPRLASPYRRGVRSPAVHGRLGAAAGALSPRQGLDRVAGV